MKTIQVSVPARFEYLGILRAAVLRVGSNYLTGGPPAELVNRWALAIHEAALNVVCHGYEGGSDEHMRLVIDLHPEEVSFTLLDYGQPNTAVPTVPPPMSESGYGLSIIHAVMDEVHYELGHPHVLRMRDRFAERPAELAQA